MLENLPSLALEDAVTVDQSVGDAIQQETVSVGTPLLFRIEVAVKLFRAGRTDFQTDLVLRKGRRKVRRRSGIK